MKWERGHCFGTGATKRSESITTGSGAKASNQAAGEADALPVAADGDLFPGDTLLQVMKKHGVSSRRA